MNGHKLLEEVSALGFESETEANSAFIVSANRALKQIFSDREVEAIARVPIARHTPASLISVYRHTPGAKQVFTLNGAAYSFTVCGEGKFTVTDGSGERSFSFSAKKTDFRGFISGRAEITFRGDLSYTVFDLACYTDIYGTGEKDIPIYSKNERYDIRDYAADFVGPIGAPFCEGITIPEAVSVSRETLTVPTDFEGEIYVPYARAPRQIDLDTLADNIDIPIECEHLLALLTASYLWLDDDGAKAQYYMSIYRSGMADVRARKNRRTGDSYCDVLGWA